MNLLTPDEISMALAKYKGEPLTTNNQLAELVNFADENGLEFSLRKTSGRIHASIVGRHGGFTIGLLIDTFATADEAIRVAVGTALVHVLKERKDAN